LDIFALTSFFSNFSRNVLNSLFLEAPYFINENNTLLPNGALPEKAQLSTWLLIAQQIASALVLFSCFFFDPVTFAPAKARFYYACIIVVTLILSILCSIVLMIWSTYTVGKLSLPFLLMAIITSILGYVSTTYYLPFVSLYKVTYTNAYTVGLGFSLAFTAIISLAQDSGANTPRFDHRGFFGIILASQVIAFVGAAWIIWSDAAKTQLVSYIAEGEEGKQTDEEPCEHQIAASHGTPISQQLRNYELKYKPAQVGFFREFSNWSVLKQYWYPPLYQFLLAFLAFGIVPGLLAFATGSYHNGNTVYMWSISLLYIVDPVARVIYALPFKFFSRVWHVNIMVVICLGLGFFICLIAGLSPDQWLRQEKNGGILVIVLSAFQGWCYSSSFVMSYTVMFNIGTEVSDDTMYDLEKEKKKSDKQLLKEHNGPKAHASSLVPIDADSVELTTPVSDEPQKDEEKTVNVEHKKGDPCPMCKMDAERRDNLRQTIYRLSGFGLQIGSAVGSFTAAGLTVFSSTIPDPVPPVFA